MAEHDDLDLLCFLGPKTQDDELNQAAKAPVKEGQITRWRVLGFFIDGGGYGMPPSRRCPIAKGLPPTTIRVFGIHTFQEMLAALDFHATFEPARNELRMRPTLAPKRLPVNGDGISSCQRPPAVQCAPGRHRT